MLLGRGRTGGIWFPALPVPAPAAGALVSHYTGHISPSASSGDPSMWMESLVESGGGGSSGASSGYELCAGPHPLFAQLGAQRICSCNHGPQRAAQMRPGPQASRNPVSLAHLPYWTPVLSPAGSPSPQNSKWEETKWGLSLPLPWERCLRHEVDAHLLGILILHLLRTCRARV